MRSRDWTRCALGSLLVLLAATAAGQEAPVDSVDLQIGVGDKVDGTISPPEERESFLVDAARGAVVKGSVKSRTRGGTRVRLELMNPDDEVVANGAESGSGAKLPPTRLEVSGGHRFRVTGDGLEEGDYQLKVKVKAPKFWGDASVASLDPGAETLFTFAADGGSVLSATASPSRGSALLPALIEVVGPGAFQMGLPAPSDGAKKHKVKGVVLPEPGEYTLRLRNVGAAGGWKIAVKLKPPKTQKTSVDLRDEALGGDFFGDQIFVGRVIGPDGGEVSAEEFLGVDVSIDVPAGAVTESAVISISEIETFFVDDERNEAGPAIQLGPAGLEFLLPVEVTIPFDPQAYDDPVAEIEIFVEEEDGTQVAIPGPYDIDVDASTVTFPTSGFSTFEPVSPKARPFRGRFVEIQILTGLENGFGGAFGFNQHTIIGDAGPRIGNGFVRSVDTLTAKWTRGSGSVATLSATQQIGGQAGTIDVVDNEEINLQILSGASIRLVRGRSPDLLVGTVSGNGQLGVSLIARETKGAPTRNSLSGGWHAIVWDFVTRDIPGAGVDLVSGIQTLELDVEFDGTTKAGKVSRDVTFSEFPSTGWQSERDKRRPANGTLLRSGKDAILSMAVGTSPLITEMRLTPVARGDVLMGVTRQVDGSVQNPSEIVSRLVILVRPPEKATTATFSGSSRLRTIELVTTAGSSTGNAPAGAAELILRDLDAVHDGQGALTASGFRRTLVHDAVGARVLTNTGVDNTASYSVRSDGSFDETGPMQRGTLTRKGGLTISLATTGDRMGLGFGLRSRPFPK